MSTPIRFNLFLTWAPSKFFFIPIILKQNSFTYIFFTNGFWLLYIFIHPNIAFFTQKRLGNQFDSLCCFSKNVSSRERVKTCFFVTFDIIVSHIFPENFIEIPHVGQNICRFSLSILTFSSVFLVFDISLLRIK